MTGREQLTAVKLSTDLLLVMTLKTVRRSHKGKDTFSLLSRRLAIRVVSVFPYAPWHEGVWGSGSLASRILNLDSRQAIWQTHPGCSLDRRLCGAPDIMCWDSSPGPSRGEASEAICPRPPKSHGRHCTSYLGKMRATVASVHFATVCEHWLYWQQRHGFWFDVADHTQ
jgi:hypothetical protein